MVVVCLLCMCSESGLRVLNSLHVLALHALPIPPYFVTPVCGNFELM